jgi:hypothetical protein
MPQRSSAYATTSRQYPYPSKSLLLLAEGNRRFLKFPTKGLDI